MSRRLLAYCRVSTEEQARDGLSIDTQRAEIERYADAHGDTVVDWFVDSGVSATARRRPEYERLQVAIEAGRGDLLVITRIDRVSRSVSGFYLLLGALEKRGVDLVALHQQFDSSTSQGRLLRNINVGLAEYESSLLSERIRDVKREQARKGQHFSAGNPPFGWRYDRLAKVLVPDEQQAPILERMYGWWLDEGASMGEIAKRLNMEGVRGRGGGIWDYTRVAHVLTCTQNAGIVQWNRAKNRSSKRAVRMIEAVLAWEPGKVVELPEGVPESQLEMILAPSASPGLIPLDRYKAAVRLYADAFRPRSQRRSSKPWTGMLRCLVCGGTMIAAYRANTERDDSRYHCIGHNRLHDDRCNGRSVTTDWLEDSALPVALQYLADRCRLDASVSKRKRARKPVQGVETQAIEAAVAAKEALIKKKVRLFEADLIEWDELQAAAVQAKADIAALRSQLATAPAQQAVTLAEVKGVVGQWELAAAETRRRILTRLIERIDVGRFSVQVWFRAGDLEGWPEQVVIERPDRGRWRQHHLRLSAEAAADPALT